MHQKSTGPVFNADRPDQPSFTKITLDYLIAEHWAQKLSPNEVADFDPDGTWQPDLHLHKCVYELAPIAAAEGIDYILRESPQRSQSRGRKDHGIPGQGKVSCAGIIPSNWCYLKLVGLVYEILRIIALHQSLLCLTRGSNTQSRH